MRLYVNPREVPLLKGALREGIAHAHTDTERRDFEELLNRVKLCEELQQSEQKAKRER